MTSATWAPPAEFAQQCRDLYGLTCPPRWGTPRRPERPTYGGKVAKVMAALGYPPMPWQRYVLDTAMEIDPETGLFAYREVGLSVPRQQGKTQQILGVMVHRCMAWARQNVVYSAQTRGMARQRWEDEFLATLDTSKLAGKYRARKSNGNEAIIWGSTRSKLGITSNTEKAGHGPPLDLGVLDEIFAHEDDRLEQAMSPAMSTRDMAQLWWASAGGTEKSNFLNRKRARGRELIERLWSAGQWPAVAYFEWYPDDEAPRDDPATWYTCMPALGITVNERTIRADLEKMEPAEFDRAYLNRTNKSTPPPDTNVPSKEWPLRVDMKSRRGPELAFAVDITPQRDHASIGVYSPREDGLGHVELVDHRPGTDWLVWALLRLRELWDPVAIGLDAKGPVGALLVKLEKAGIAKPEHPDKPKRGELWIPTTQEVAAACGSMADAIRQEDGLRHIDQPQLNIAVAGARTRPLVDAWAWARRSASVDISPLVCVSLARAAYEARAHLVTQEAEPSVIWV